MFLKDLLFPKFCLGCGFLGSYICLKCRNKLRYREKDSCLYCGRSSLYGLTHPACRRRFGIDGTMSLFHYNDFLKKIVKSVKYRLAVEVWKELCLTIRPDFVTKLSFYSKISSHRGSVCIQSIPLHAKRLRQRGFNQAQIAAEFFQSLLQIPLTDILRRKKETAAQAQLKKGQERYRNMQGAFDITKKEDVTKKTFILVDDVVTSGATIKEAGIVLKLNGAWQVFALTLARG